MMLNNEYKAIWPRVKAGMWCGEYRSVDVVDVECSSAPLFYLEQGK
jgi:hypothetical protein